MSKPSPQEVAQRLLILKYQVIHAFAMPPQEMLQKIYSQWSKDEQRKFTQNYKKHADQFVASMKFNKLWNQMTKVEKEFAQSYPPKMKLQQHLNALWCQESAVTLMWALGMIQEFPPFYTHTSEELLKQVSHEDLGKFIHSSTLLPEENIEKKRSLAELWHWRSRTRQLVEMKQELPPNTGYASFDQLIQAVANEALKQGDLSQVVDNDFLAKGKAYRDLSDEEWSEVRSITMERHFALNWVCGYAPGNRWDKTPTVT